MEKEYADINELQAFILDSLTLYRKAFSEQQLDDILDVLNKIKSKKGGTTDSC